MELKAAAKKVWHFIWEDDSIWSWLVNIILAVVIIKFVVYPGLGFALGTTHPIVAVVSGSMEHDGNFDSWWETQKSWYFDKTITKEMFVKYPFRNGFNKGDIMILYKPNDLKAGDVIVFRASRPEPIIHRIILVGDGFYQTKGDHNSDSTFDERNIKQSDIIGKAVFRIPYLGYIKIFAVEAVCLIDSEMNICGI